jgi:hypothetical protein
MSAAVGMRRIDKDLRRAGLRAAREGDLAEQRGDHDAARDRYREALRDLVDAFLEDRKANGDLFVVAHRVGEALENLGGCLWEFDEERRTFSNLCPIQALHSRMAVSVAMITESVCSICGAGDFECEHVPGRTYDGEECVRTVTRIVKADHIALTRNPDFTSTFRISPVLSVREVEQRTGEKWVPGKRLFSHHCQQCYGRFEARAEDLDRSLWKPIPEPTDE